MKLFITGIGLFIIVLSSCGIAEKNIAGTYQPVNLQRARLILKQDKTFELSMPDPVTDTLLINTPSLMNVFTTGSWYYDKKEVVLKSAASNDFSNAKPINDSITRFTSISSLNFWNRYGDPVSIRYIILPAMRTKPHFGNSLYFFSQDFKETDTLRFYFEGYPPFNFPGSIPSAIGNNIHKITLFEPYRPAAFSDLHFMVKRNGLIDEKNRLRLKKRKEKL